MKWTSAAIVLVSLPFVLGMHCRRDCTTVVRAPVPVAHSPSRGELGPYPLERGKLYELRLAAGVVANVSASGAAIVVYRDVSSATACAALAKSSQSSARIEPDTRPSPLPAARPIEPFGLRPGRTRESPPKR